MFLLTKCLPGKLIAVDLGTPVRTLTSPARWRTSKDPLSVPLDDVVSRLLAQLPQSPVQIFVL